MKIYNNGFPNFWVWMITKDYMHYFAGLQVQSATFFKFDLALVSVNVMTTLAENNGPLLSWKKQWELKAFHKLSVVSYTPGLYSSCLKLLLYL